MSKYDEQNIMSKYNEMQKLIKYLKFILSNPDHRQASRPQAGDVLRIVTLLAADRFLYSGQYASSTKNMPACPEILDRNQVLLDVFSRFFKDVNWDCLNSHWIQLQLLLGSFHNRELLHIPGLVHEALINLSDAADTSKRKNQGSYYTPVHIVRYMVENAVSYFTGLKKIEGLKIIDPACGGGSFLLEAWFALTELGLPGTRAAEYIFGMDIDETAVRLTNFVMAVAVWAKSGHHAELSVIKSDWEQRLSTGNSLIDVKRPDLSGFDLVIGNPPYISNKLISPWDKKYYRARYASAQGQFDLSVPFIEHGLNLLKTGGILSYIISNKFLAADYGGFIRRILLEDNRINEVIDVSTLNSFAGTAAYPVILTVCREKPSPAETIRLAVVSDWHEVENKEFVQVEQEFFLTGPDYLITTHLDNSILPIIQRLEAFDRLIPQRKIKCGLAITGFNKWIVRNPVSQRDLYSFIQAGNIRPYQIEDHDFIEKGHFSEVKAKDFKGVKLVIPGIAAALKAAVDCSGSILGRVYYIKQDEIYIDLNFLVVLLNSQVLNFYYKIKYWAVHLAGGYLRFNSGYLANLPIPYASGQLWEGKVGQNMLAEKIAEIGGIMSGARPPVEPLEKAESTAEALVFLLYGLDSAEAEKIMRFNGLEPVKCEKIKDMMKEVVNSYNITRNNYI